MSESRAQPYDDRFYDHVQTTADQSARAMLPWILELVRPRSVVDIGCGEGAWLSVAESLGVKDFLGIDGNYVDRSRLQIPQPHFAAVDLSLPFTLPRSFDLAICLEVAEHLPASAARNFVRSIGQHSDIVLFSAAAPFQLGTDHQNEQWPRYWIDLFAETGFEAADVVRPAFWIDDRISSWYRQNSVLFVRRDVPAHSELITAVRKLPSFGGLPIIHPSSWEWRCSVATHSAGELAGPRELISKLPTSIVRAIRRRLGAEHE